MDVIHFGSKSEFIEIELPESFSDEGWAQVDVEIVVNCFRGKVKPWVDSGDFERFTKALRSLYDTLKGEAEFTPREGQFTLKMVGKTGGRIEVSGEAWSQATYENKLEFTLDLDQTYLLLPLSELESIMARNMKNDI